VLRSAEGWLGIDNPVVAEQGSEPCGEASWLRKWREVTVELELVLVEGGLQSGDEFTAKDAAEHLDRQQAGGTGSDPARVVRRESAAGNDAVDVRMWSECLSPGVQDGQEAKLCAEMLRIYEMARCPQLRHASR
jgi:hypothetical protein